MSGNTILITGGSSGIGYALAEAFLAADNTVVICARGKARLDAALEKHPDLRAHVCDVANDVSRRVLLRWIRREHVGLNVLVNNAGIQRDIDFTRGLGQFLAGENEIRINLEAPIILSGLLIPLLAGNPDPAIINVSSGLGFVPAARTPVYSASKAGMHAFSMALRRQLATIGMKVYEVVPPAVDTHLNPVGRAQYHFKAGLAPREFVAAVMTALKNDVPEIGYGLSTRFLQASRHELDESFERLNRAM